MIFSYLQNMQSHPSWVCGLKQKYDENNALASRNYELHHQEENVEQQRGLK